MVDKSQIIQRLEGNRRSRKSAEAKLVKLRKELGELLDQGHAANVPVADMAAAAGITRQAAYKRLGKEKS